MRKRRRQTTFPVFETVRIPFWRSVVVISPRETKDLVVNGGKGVGCPRSYVMELILGVFARRAYRLWLQYAGVRFDGSARSADWIVFSLAIWGIGSESESLETWWRLRGDRPTSVRAGNRSRW